MRIDWARVCIVALILVAAIVANVVANLQLSRACSTRFPVIGARRLGRDPASPRRCGGRTGSVLPETFKGTIFLLALVTCRLDDAGREAARRLLADGARASASSRPCSTTSR